MQKFFKVVLVLFLIGISQLSYADLSSELESGKSFTFSSGYFEKVFNSNEGLSYFPLSAIQLYSEAFDSITKNLNTTPGKRGSIVFLELPFSYWIAHSLFIPYHEFGHARAVAATDNNYNFTSFGLGGSTTVSSYWGLSLLRLMTPPFGFPGSGIAVTNYLGILRNPLTSSLNTYYGTAGLDIIRSSGGLNNQMLLAKKVSDLVYASNGHITYFQHYIGNKIAGFIYSKMDQNSNPSDDPLFASTSDISAILAGYSAKGYGISHSDLEQQSLVSLFSGTTYSFLRGFYNYINSGKPTVEVSEIFGVRIPDINVYVNARGLSYEFVTGYRFTSNFRLDLSYERVWKGDSTQQLTPRAHYQLASLFPKLNDFWISTDIVIGSGIGGSLEARWTPYFVSPNDFLKQISYFTRITLYNAYTLYGERNTPSFNNEVSPELIAGLSYRY